MTGVRTTDGEGMKNVRTEKRKECNRRSEKRKGGMKDENRERERNNLRTAEIRVAGYRQHMTEK